MSTLPDVQSLHLEEENAHSSHSHHYQRRQPFHPAKLYDMLAAQCMLPIGGAAGEQTGAKRENNNTPAGVHLEGCVWLATRPDLAGRLVMDTHGVASLQHDTPWLAALPASAWTPEDHDASADIFMPGVGDRRQSLHITASSAHDAHILSQALDTCLVTDPMQLLANPPHDPWQSWPSLGTFSTQSTSSSSTSQAALRTPAPPAPPAPPAQPPHHTLSIEILAITQGAPEVSAWLDSAHQSHIPTALVFWHTHHTPLDHPMLLALATLAHAYKDRVRVCALEVHGQSKNQTFGFNSRVLRFPDSRRRGARSRPVLACGHPYPAVTVHGVPELHARALFAGPTAMEELANHLENICTLPPHPNEKTPRVVLRCASPPDPPNSTSQPPSLDKNEPLVLDQGPGQLKSMLKEAQANQRLLVLIWQSPGDAMSLQDTVCALAPGLRGLVFALADATEPRNALLAQRLGVCVLPTVHVYNGMKLHTALKGPSVQQCTSCLHACNTLQTEVTVAGEQDGQQEDGQQEDGQQEDDFEPPAGGAGKGVRQFAAGVGHFYPKMPCLQCGCPWWLGEDWDARCARCGWDCEADGYDDDSKPKPAYVKKWREYVKEIAQGATPSYAG